MSSVQISDPRTFWGTSRNHAPALAGSEGKTSLRDWASVFRAPWVRYLLLPLLGLATLTALIRWLDLDRCTNRLFFDAAAGQFPGLHDGWWLFVYRYGPIPGLAMGISATALFVASFVWQTCRPFRERCALLALLLALGPGLLVNGLLKPIWDRPRPCELAEFGGRESFVPVLSFANSREHVSKSFPSGHASIGFYLLAPVFVLARNRRRWSMAFLILGIALGLTMGLGRIAQGRHYPSDVVWAAAVVYFTGLALAYFLRPAPASSEEHAANPAGSQDEPWIVRWENYGQSKHDEPAAVEAPVREVLQARAA